MQDKELRLSVLKELQRFLVLFVEDISAKSEEFSRRVSQLREIGVAVQIAEYYEANFATQNLRHLRNLIAHITDVYLPHINALINQLEQTPVKMIYEGYSGTPVYRVEGNMVYIGYTGTPVYRIEGNMIYEGYTGTPVYRIENSMIYKGYSGTPVYRIEGNMIYTGYSGEPVYRIEKIA